MPEFKVVGLLEPLHLSRPEADDVECSGKSGVFVAPLYQQHLLPFQKDGIRFLYKQFCKKQPGVILNDGPGHGKTVQILLFLSAINVLLRQQPCLIICENMTHWKYHICKWIERGMDLIGGPENVFAKKLYFLANLEDIHCISRREWAVVVVDNVELSSFIRKSHLIRAKYKIWMSNKDLRSDLVSLNKIHHWLSPQAQINLVQKFSADGLDHKAAYRKKLDLDTFCNNLLLRRTNEKCLALLDPELQDEIVQQWLEEGAREFSEGDIEITTSLSKIAVTNDNKDQSQKIIKNEPSSSGQEIKLPKRPKNSVATSNKHKNDLQSGSPKEKKIKLSSSKSSEDDSSLEFLENSPVLKKEIIEKENEINDLNNSQEVEKRSDSAEFVSANVNNCKSDERHRSGMSEKSAADSDYTEISFASTSNHNRSIRTEKSNSIIESGLSTETSVNSSKIITNSDTIRREMENQTAPNSAIDHKNTQNLKVSPRNAKDAVKKEEERSNKKFKGTFLDSLF